MLRFASPVHIQIGHGESDKGGSVSNQHKAYDLTFVGGDAGRDRLSQALRGFDGERAHAGRWPSAARLWLPRRSAVATRFGFAGVVRAHLGGGPAEHRVRVAGQPRRGDSLRRCLPIPQSG